MPRALLSVSDKNGLVPFAESLQRLGWTIFSTGGTARALREAGVDVREVTELTGHPEIMEGRVKTLHPAVHAGLLGRRGHESDEREMAELGYVPLDLVAVNLYPFRETVARSGVSDQEAIEQIDIGGPAMLRSAAKNHESVWVVVDPADYERVFAAVRGRGESPLLRRELAAKVYAHTSAYDSAITEYLSAQAGKLAATERELSLPFRIEVRMEQVQPLRYGENPDQVAAFYREEGVQGGLADLKQLHGKELSFNNLLDVDAALSAVGPWREGERAACAIIKHTTPCGLAVGDYSAEAYRKALKTDPLSAFGSVVAFSQPVDERCATLLRPNFVEAVVAPEFGPRALAILREKKNIRLLELSPTQTAAGLDFKRVRGGFLVQERMRLDFAEEEWRVVTSRHPEDGEWDDLRFAWRAVASVKSNAIVIARDGATLGIGAGQMSRVDSSRIAVLKAGDNASDLSGAVLASDAFFPFRDGVDTVAPTGVRAIIQPGGSVRDDEVIAAADEHGIAMVFTGRRLFRH